MSLDEPQEQPWWSRAQFVFIFLILLWILIWPAVLLNIQPWTGWKKFQDRWDEPNWTLTVTIFGWFILIGTYYLFK